MNNKFLLQVIYFEIGCNNIYAFDDEAQMMSFIEHLSECSGLIYKQDVPGIYKITATFTK